MGAVTVLQIRNFNIFKIQCKLISIFSVLSPLPSGPCHVSPSIKLFSREKKIFWTCGNLCDLYTLKVANVIFMEKHTHEQSRAQRLIHSFTFRFLECNSQYKIKVILYVPWILMNSESGAISCWNMLNHLLQLYITIHNVIIIIWIVVDHQIAWIWSDVTTCCFSITSMRH